MSSSSRTRWSPSNRSRPSMAAKRGIRRGAAPLMSVRSRSHSNNAIFVNVHVGGVIRSRDAGRTWTTVDIESDIHQVIAHPTRADVVLAAAYKGFGLSRDG